MTILFVTINKIIYLYIRDIIEFMISISSMTRSIPTSKTHTRPTLTRKKSQYFTDQWNEGTCYAHVSSILIGRLLKLYFSEYFGKEIELCDYYYNTLLCNNGNIFECFKNDKEKQPDKWNCKRYIFNEFNELELFCFEDNVDTGTEALVLNFLAKKLLCPDN